MAPNSMGATVVDDDVVNVDDDDVANGDDDEDGADQNDDGDDDDDLNAGSNAGGGDLFGIGSSILEILKRRMG